MSKIRSTFNSAASNYDDNAFLQSEIANRLAEKLKVISIKPQTIIDLGSGTGLLSNKTAEIFPNANLICVDFAQQSLLKNPQNLKVCANAYELPFASNSVDFIVSNLMMQWCPDLKALFNECFRVLKPEGLILFTTFGPDTLKELKRSWSAVDSSAHVNNFIDMHDIGDQMLQSGFQSPIMEMENITLTYEKVLDLMHDLKSIGAQNVGSRSKALTGKTKFKKMIEMYESYRSDGKLPATYEVIYGHAWKNENKLGAISLEN
ncbi:malonyl-ACP O-methyltransferase BioC [Candidatus Thioglobus sp.]|nr:malonyl-ACP O-methyltransferase BioC [Candidatus Thioglobus sp.]